jgi:hypothetical protein
MADVHTHGAFLFGLRLMAIDGEVISLPDTPENARHFGRSRTDRGQSAYPQAQAVHLCECGTHAILDAGLWPCAISERLGARRLLRSVHAGMLLMWDRGLHSFEQVEATLRTGAHLLSRLPAHVKPGQLQVLADGSRLVELFPSDPHKRRQGRSVRVRLIEYTLTDPARPGAGQRHRLITSLLDPAQSGARELVCAYHQRWEMEGSLDEIEVHQCQGKDPLLRSKKAVGVIQEFYGLLIAHYIVRFWMHQAAREQDIDPDRISFTATLRLLGDMSIAFALLPPKLWPELSQTMLCLIGRHRLPERRLRSYPRVVKRKMSTFALKRDEHRSIRQPTKAFRDAVCLI